MDKRAAVYFFIGTIIAIIAIPAQAIIINNKDWRQLTETTGYSYNDILSVCDANTGICNGSLINVGRWGEVDFTGWTWASVYDVGAMFDAIPQPNIGPPGHFITPNSYSEKGSAWAPAMIDRDGPYGVDQGLFQATFADTLSTDLAGITRTAYTSEFVYTSSVSDHVADSFNDVASTSAYSRKDVRTNRRGVWLYQQVPEPATLALMSLGLAGIGFARKKKQS